MPISPIDDALRALRDRIARLEVTVARTRLVAGTNVTYDGTDTGATATDMQEALDEHVLDTTDAHDASAVSYSNYVSGLTADDVQSAIDEVAAAGPGSLALDDLTDVNAPTPSDNQILTWDDGTSEWVAAAPPSGTVPDGTTDGDLLVWDDYTSAWTVLAIGDDDDVLTADTAQPYGVKWAAPTSGAAIQYPSLKPATPTDDFDAASLTGWTAHSSQGSFATTHTLTRAIDGSHVRVQYSDQMGFLYQSHSNTDLDIQLGETFSEGFSAAVMWGIAALDSSGNGVALVMYNDNDAYLTTITSWNYPGSYLAVAVGYGLPAGGTATSGRRWLRLVRSTNSWTGYLSVSGRAWDISFGPSSQTYTIDKVGFGILYNTATSYKASFAADWWHVA